MDHIPLHDAAGMEAYLDRAVAAARAGAEVILRGAAALHTLHVDTKRPNDFVSEVDRGAERAIIATLRAAFPTHAILAEESGGAGSSDHTWIIDPLDGTTNFLHGLPHHCISIALRRIPPQLADAALLEGASRLQYLRRVVLPLLMPTTLFILVNAIVNAFRVVDHVIIMTQGGPDNGTMLLLYYIYQTGFNYWDTGYAAAITVLLLLILAAAAIGQFMFLDRRTH